MSDTVRRLRMGRSLAQAKFGPSFDWAIHEAIEAEYRASVASDAVQAGIAPTYPTIVHLLAEAVTADEASIVISDGSVVER